MIGVGIHTNIGPSRKTVIQNWTPQDINTNCLFFASHSTDLLSKVVSTQLPNQVTGSTDYLTVTDSGLNSRFRTPDTAAYRAADSDYCFWKTDASESICDGNRLIGYDFPRILIKYLDVAPYTIQWIAILKVGVTVTDRMFTAFRLPLFWSGVENVYGYIKGNRGLAQNVWTPEVVYGAEIIQDGTFDTAWNVNWTGDNTNWDIASNKANYLASTASAGIWDSSLNSSVENGATYKLEFDISGSAGTAGVYISNAAGAQIFTQYADYVNKANGHHTEEITAIANATSFSVYAKLANGAYSIDNITLKKKI